MEDMYKYIIYFDLVKWFKCVEGYLWYVIGMIEGGEICFDIVCQFVVVESVVMVVKCVLIYDYIDYCLFYDEDFVLIEMKVLIKLF